MGSRGSVRLDGDPVARDVVCVGRRKYLFRLAEVTRGVPLSRCRLIGGRLGCGHGLRCMKRGAIPLPSSDPRLRRRLTGCVPSIPGWLSGEANQPAAYRGAPVLYVGLAVPGTTAAGCHRIVSGQGLDWAPRRLCRHSSYTALYCPVLLCLVLCRAALHVGDGPGGQGSGVNREGAGTPDSSLPGIAGPAAGSWA